MKFYTKQYPHYCGIDLHARILYVCILPFHPNLHALLSVSLASSFVSYLQFHLWQRLIPMVFLI